jgi:hypothetical protein
MSLDSVYISCKLGYQVLKSTVENYMYCSKSKQILLVLKKAWNNVIHSSQPEWENNGFWFGAISDFCQLPSIWLLYCIQQLQLKFWRQLKLEAHLVAICELFMEWANRSALSFEDAMCNKHTKVLTDTSNLMLNTASCSSMSDNVLGSMLPRICEQS